MKTTINKEYGPNICKFVGNVVLSKKTDNFTRPAVRPFDLTKESISMDHGLVVANMILRLMEITHVDGVYISGRAVNVLMSEGSVWNEDIDKIVESAFNDAGTAIKPTDTRIVVKTYVVEYHRDFHVNFEISQSFRQEFHRPLRPESSTYLKSLGPKGSNLIQLLFKIQGISKVVIQPYQLDIAIGEAFVQNWTKIQENVVTRIESIFGPVMEIVIN